MEQLIMSKNLPRFFRFTVLILVSLVSTNVSLAQRKCCAIDRSSTDTVCPFDRSTFSFAGSPLEQARCLLRHVQIRGHLDPALDRLPGPLEDLIGKTVTVTPADLRRYLSSHGILPSDIGGELDKPLSPADSTQPRGERARYFVMHDTSTPNYVTAFPGNIDEESWSQNRFLNIDPTITHVYVNRLGKSKTVVTFDKVLPATKFGTKFACCLGERRKGLFIHIELMQPRRCDPSHGRCTPDSRQRNLASHSSNDNLATEPGFTKAQLDRLALLYVAASVRKGEWLIPAFHGPMDATIAGAHDDPQNFDLAAWAASLNNLLAELRGQSRLRRPGTPRVVIDSACSLEEAIGSQNVPAEVRANLVLVNVRYYSFDSAEHQGQVLIHKDLERDVAGIFTELLQKKFPIAKAIPVSKYGFSDEMSMEDNNTSAFNYRVIAGTTTLSKHAVGRAIDINPLLNPYIRGSTVEPLGAKYDPKIPGTILEDGVVVAAFKKRGWAWGGEWNSLKDYQHFEK